MSELKLNSIFLKSGKRTFTTERIPVASVLGRKLIFGKDSNAVVQAVRSVAKNGNSINKVTLKTKISDSQLEKSK